MIETATVAAQSNSFSLSSIFSNPLVQYIVSPTIVFSILTFIFYRVLNLGSVLAKFDQSLKDIGTLEKDVKKLLSHMDIVKTHLVTKTGLDSNLFVSASPLQLTQKGTTLLDKSGFKEIYKEKKEWFITEVKKYDIKSASDIDEASVKIMEKCKNDENFSNFKEIAFQNGVTLEVLLRVFSIYLRDELIKEILK